MLKLRTVYPYALNNQLEDEYKKDDTIVLQVTNFQLYLENKTGFLMVILK